MEKLVAFVGEAPTGRWHITPDGLGYLDESGPGYESRRAAIRAARRLGYTHYRVGSRVRLLKRVAYIHTDQDGRWYVRPYWPARPTPGPGCWFSSFEEAASAAKAMGYTHYRQPESLDELLI